MASPLPNMETKRKIWVAQVIQARKEGESPFYLFRYANDESPTGTACLYSGNGFVKTDNPATAILLQQLLNDGSLTVKPFTTETNQ